MAEPLTTGTTSGDGLEPGPGDPGAGVRPVLPAPVGPNAATVAAAAPVPALSAGFVESAVSAPGVPVDGAETRGVPAPFAVPPPDALVPPPWLAPGVPPAPVVPPLPVVP